MNPARTLEARQLMVDSQLRPNEVNDDRIIDAVMAVPRELFVPKARRSAAYIDEDLPLGGGRYVMEPMIFARLLVAADIKDKDCVLDIGSATGYSSAVLSHLAESVVSVEADADMAHAAEKTFSELELHNIAALTGDMAIQGDMKETVSKQGPFDVIILQGAVDGGVEEIAQHLADGGRLVCVKVKNAVGRAHIITRRGDVFAGHDLFDAHIPYLPGFEQAASFEF